MKTCLKLRLSQQDAHYGGNLVDGAKALALFGDAATELLTDEAAYAAMSTSRSPYGDGRAAARIRHAVLGHLGIESPAEEPWVE